MAGSKVPPTPFYLLMIERWHDRIKWACSMKNHHRHSGYVSSINQSGQCKTKGALIMATSISVSIMLSYWINVRVFFKHDGHFFPSDSPFECKAGRVTLGGTWARRNISSICALISLQLGNHGVKWNGHARVGIDSGNDHVLSLQKGGRKANKPTENAPEQ